MSADFTLLKKRTLRVSASLVALFSLFTITGCEDQLLPVEPGNQTTVDPGTVVFTEINDRFDIQNNAVLARINADGASRADLTQGFLQSAPGSAATAIQRDDNSVWLAPIKGAAPVTVQLVAIGQADVFEQYRIDAFSIATAPSGTRVTYTTAANRTTVIAGVGGSDSIALPRAVARETTPSFSPDGSRLAFFSHDQSGSGTGPGSLYVVNVDGTDLHMIEALERIPGDGQISIEWSPSGNRLAYTRKVGSETQVRVIGVDGSGGQTIASAMLPTWKPAGDSILYTSVPASSATFSDLYLIAADGSGAARQITATPSIHEMYARYSPDGKKILYTTYAGEPDEHPGHLIVKDPATGTTRLLSDKAYKGFWVK